MLYAEKINGEWTEKTPRQFRNERNASIPEARLADEGLHEVTIDPRPDAPGQIVEPGLIVDREGLPVRTWTTRDPTPDESTEMRKRLKRQVETERDRRIDAGFTWNGHLFQSDRDSRENIAGAATSATAYIVSGGSPDEAYWQSPDTPFVWLTSDNTQVQMTPAQVISFGNAALAHKKKHIFAARTIKDMVTIPQDFADNKYWP